MKQVILPPIDAQLNARGVWVARFYPMKMACGSQGPELSFHALEFEGEDAERAIQLAVGWWMGNKEVKRMNTEPNTTTSTESNASAAPRQRGQANKGKTWVVNHETGHFTRVMPEEVDQWLAKGYVKGRRVKK